MTNKEIRRERLRRARLKGTHTREEWLALKHKFQNRCVRCGTDEYNVERDHIIPLYQDGSDSIDNIQPLCARCNCSKGPEDIDWRVSFFARFPEAR
jgi:5-methylcytosine-specific restriction endonuclease McrA